MENVIALTETQEDNLLVFFLNAENLISLYPATNEVFRVEDVEFSLYETLDGDHFLGVTPSGHRYDTWYKISPYFYSVVVDSIEDLRQERESKVNAGEVVRKILEDKK